MDMQITRLPYTLKLIGIGKRLKEIEEIKKNDGSLTAKILKEKKMLEGQAKKLGLNFWFFLGFLLAIAIISAVFKSLIQTQENWFSWLINISEAPIQIGTVTSVLATLLAVAVAIERLLETVFDWYEQSVRSVSDVISEIRKPIDWIEEELLQAYKALETAAKTTDIAVDKVSLNALDVAEQRLTDAEKRLINWIKAPEYIAWKRAICIWVGLLVGLEIAIIADLGMLRIIGIPAPRILDMILTGFVIGAGPGPMHSIIGIIQSGKEAVDKLGKLVEGKAIREAAEALKQSIR